MSKRGPCTRSQTRKKLRDAELECARRSDRCRAGTVRLLTPKHPAGASPIPLCAAHDSCEHCHALLTDGAFGETEDGEFYCLPDADEMPLNADDEHVLTYCGFVCAHCEVTRCALLEWNSSLASDQPERESLCSHCSGFCAACGSNDRGKWIKVAGRLDARRVFVCNDCRHSGEAIVICK